MEGEKGIRWEGILKKESVRVLLAESDDCTREIVAALLRKCGYRVASASDGLKAWEILKANRQDMDLILMEVELPLLSGFDLLTLIMENETLKNIPVIMMSSHDYIGMVFKFMLKGAADFLVKPLRKNELRNLWQHVWRRSSLNGALGETRNLQDAKPARQKFEVDLENDAASNLYGDHISHAKGSEDEIGCDTQSSCTWPDMDAEGPYSQSIDEYSEKQMRGITKNSRHATQEARDSDQIKISATHIIEAFGCNDMYESFGTKGENSDQIKACVVNPALVGVLDKPICAQKFEKIPTGANAHGDAKVLTDSYYPMPKPSSTTRPKLELSLKMNNSGNYDSSATERQNVLNHSTFSPFSRYSKNSTMCTHPSSVAEEKEGSHHKILLMEQNVQDECFHTSNYAPLSKNKAFSLNGEDTSSTLTISSNQEEKAGKLENPHINPYTVPAKHDNSFSAFFPSVEPTVSPQLGAPPWMTDTAVTKPMPVHFSRQLGSEAHNTVQSHQSHGQNAATEECSIRKQVEVEGIVNCSSPVGEDRSSNTGNIHKDCNDDVHGSVCNGSDDVAAKDKERSAAENLGCGGIPSLNAIHLSQAQRSIHREAALNKFRQKRKERCFEKKVRYQSRKKLADQRPRIKGQFVRHVSESAQANSCGNDLTA